MHRFLGLPVGHSWAPGEGLTVAEQIALIMSWLVSSWLGLIVLLAALVFLTLSVFRALRFLRSRRLRRRKAAAKAEAPVSLTRLRLSRMPPKAEDDDDEDEDDGEDEDDEDEAGGRPDRGLRARPRA